MKFRFKKLITVLIITTFVVPTTFFSMPKKADAVGTGLLACAMTAIFGKAMDKIQNTVSGIMAVPVRDVGVQSNTSDIKQEVKSQTFKDCVLDAVVWDVANTLIKNITASTIEWINSGFDGSPSFVTDPEGFFTDVGDQIAGSWIEGLGPIGRILCSPFDLQIRLALGFGYMGRGDYYFTVGCRLSDVQKNIYNAFTGGQWGADGWQNWISISQPQNNAFGVYIRAENDMLMRAAEKVGIQKTELSWGNGFRSFKKCKPNPYEPEEQICENTTPGAVIETQLNSVIGSGQRKLEVADEINEIADALLNQLMNKIFSSSGLIGTSRSGSSYNSGKSYLSGLMSTYESQVAQRDVLPPKGMSCGQTYRYVELLNNADGKSQFRVEKYDKMGWFKRTNGKFDVDADGNKICTLTKPGTSLNPPAECPYYTIVPKTADSPIGDGGIVTGIEISEFESQFNLGCSNLATNSPTQDLANSAAGEPGWGLEKPETVTSQAKNVLIDEAGKVRVTQSSVLKPSYSTADRAIDGQYNTCFLRQDCRWKDDDGDYKAPLNYAITLNVFPSYWQATFPRSRLLKVKIYPMDDSSRGNKSIIESNVGNVVLKFYSNNNLIKEIPKTLLAQNLVNPNVTRDGYSYYLIDISSENIVADTFKIELIKDGSGHAYKNMLILDEVELLGTSDLITDPNNPPPPPGVIQSLAKITSPDITGISLRENSALNVTEIVTVASSENLPNPMYGTVSLKRRTGVSTLVPVNFSEIFDSFEILRTIQRGQIAQGFSDKITLIDMNDSGVTVKKIDKIDETIPPQRMNYLTVKGKIKDSVNFGNADSLSYTITIELKENTDGVEKLIGTQNISLIILPSFQ